MYMIWWMDTTAKGANKNTSPNVTVTVYYLNFTRYKTQNNISISKLFPVSSMSLQVVNFLIN